MLDRDQEIPRLFTVAQVNDDHTEWPTVPDDRRSLFMQIIIECIFDRRRAAASSISSPCAIDPMIDSYC